MIIFNKVSVKNFGPVGNQVIDIYLDRYQSTWVKGVSGTGKSYLVIESIFFALFGKPFRNINKPSLINDVNNKECIVKIYFTIQNDKFEVHRGIKPAVFDILKNGHIINTLSNNKDYQKLLENDILKMNENIFRQIVMLGSACYTPFISLPVAERRTIIENLLDLNIFSKMAAVLKIKIDVNKISIYELDIKLTNVDDKIKMLNKQKQEITKNSQNKYQQNQELIDTFLFKKSEIENSLSSIQVPKKINKKNEILGKINDLEVIVKSEKINITNMEKEKKFYQQNENCPVCKQPIKEDTKDIHLQEKENAIKDSKNKIESLTQKILSLKEMLKIVEESEIEYQKAIDLIKVKKIELKNIEDKIELLSNIVNDVEQDIEPIIKELENLEEEKVNLSLDKNKLLEEREYLNYSGILLKDTGIKSKIIEKYLPVLNKIINQNLNFFGLFIGMKFDSTFVESFSARYKENYKFEKFSEGEKSKISLSIILAFRELAKLRYSINTNLLIIDEILDSSLDKESTNKLIELFTTAFDDKTNIFVISHKDEYRHLNTILEVQKVGNFTKIKSI